ncbi:hypothetical protein KC19_9G108600 [Ceratodon purpureus]|uniref:Uncharacterized protein n=1 Tax=Ceratodon purpureus TaxID=3225 RepID=A0A8T0GW98_CERPU|nr:hypothetical protein KC19_9G108600 [Ceratodon purpureus]
MRRNLEKKSREDRDCARRRVLRVCFAACHRRLLMQIPEDVWFEVLISKSLTLKGQIYTLFAF